MKRLIFSLLFLHLCTSQIFGQHSIRYSFTDTSNNGYQFTYKRNFLSESVFEEVGLFNLDSCKKYTFKKLNDRWYLKLKNKWYPFFDGSNKIATSFKNGEYTFSIDWEKTNIVDSNNNQVYKLRFKPVGFSISGNPVYYFTYTDGVIGIDGHETFMLRTDKQILHKDKAP